MRDGPASCSAISRRVLRCRCPVPIGPSWLTRCFRPRDLVRRTISLAVASWAVLTASVGVGCSFPTRTVLPETAVPDAAAVGAFSAIRMSCSDPIALEQDCSDVWGPQREIRIHYSKVKIAGSRDGTVIMMAGPRPNIDSMLGRHDDITNAGYQAITAELARQGIQVVSVAAVADGGWLYGYLIETDRDAYSLLKRFSVE